MLIIDGVEYLVEKEAAQKYGYSIHWFRKARYTDKTPKYYKLNGKIFYTTSDLDIWFKDHLEQITN